MDNERSATIKIGGEEYEMILTTKATKAIAGRYGGLENLGEKLMKSENFEMALDEIVWLITLLANQSILIYNLKHKDTTPLNLTVPTANGVNPRIDRVVLRWSNLDRAINLAVKTGTPASVPAPPDLTRTADAFEMALANITVNKGVIGITADSIADTRLAPDVCGQVNSTVLAVYE